MGTGTSPASISCGLIAIRFGASPRFGTKPGRALVRRRKPFQDWELRLGYPDTFRTRCRTICRARTPRRRRKSLAGKDFGPRKNAFYGLFVRHRCRTRPPEEAYALRQGGDEVRGASARQINHVRHGSPNSAPQKSRWIITVLWNKRKRFWKTTSRQRRREHQWPLLTVPSHSRLAAGRQTARRESSPLRRSCRPE